MCISLNRTVAAAVVGVGLVVFAELIVLFGNPGFGLLHAEIAMAVLIVLLSCNPSVIRDQTEGKAVRIAISPNDVRPAVCGCLAASVLILQYLEHPFVWIDLLLAVLCCWVVYRRRPARFVLVNVAAVLATLAASEAWFSRSVGPTLSYTVEQPPGTSYFRRDPLLGDAACPNVRAVQRLSNPDGSEIFRATYTIDARGLRVTPERDPVERDSMPAIVFFGCSFTFGEGVGDERSMPYRVGLLQPAYQVYNFGFHGFGPQQMLATIESGRMERIVTTTPKFVIYQMIIDHVWRASNRVPYQPHAPVYGVVDGQVRLLGHSDDALPSLILRRQLRKSSIYSRLIEPQLWTNADVELTVAIVERARTLVGERFPHCEFHVLFWDYPQERVSQQLLKQMRRGSLNVHLMSDILPDYVSQGWKYSIPGDLHPNAEAHDLIARYIGSHIIEASAEKGETSGRRSPTEIRTSDKGTGD